MIYSLVARNYETILVEINTAKGFSNAGQFARSILKSTTKIPSLSYTPPNNDQYTFHFINQRTFTFLVMTSVEFKSRIALTYLNEIIEKFFSGEIPDQQRYGKENCLNNTYFHNFMKERMSFRNNLQNDVLSQLQFQVQEVKGLMIDNIDKMLERGEKLENLVQKSNQIKTEAFTFKRQAQKIRRVMWWKNTKIQIIICLVILVIIYLIIGVTCGFGFQCARSNSNTKRLLFTN